jgi:hypothetical protein
MVLMCLLSETPRRMSGEGALSIASGLLVVGLNAERRGDCRPGSSNRANPRTQTLAGHFDYDSNFGNAVDHQFSTTAGPRSAARRRCGLVWRFSIPHIPAPAEEIICPRKKFPASVGREPTKFAANFPARRESRREPGPQGLSPPSAGECRIVPRSGLCRPWQRSMPVLRLTQGRGGVGRRWRRGSVHAPDRRCRRSRAS